MGRRDEGLLARPASGGQTPTSHENPLLRSSYVLPHSIFGINTQNQWVFISPKPPYPCYPRRHCLGQWVVEVRSANSFFLIIGFFKSLKYQSIFCFNFLILFPKRTLKSNSYPCCSMQWSFIGWGLCGCKTPLILGVLHRKQSAVARRSFVKSEFSWTKELWRDNRKSLKAALQRRRLLLKLCKIKRHQIFLFGYNTCISTNTYSLLASSAEVCFCKLESKDLGRVLFYKDFPISKRCFD